MREILFRGKTEQGEWVLGDYYRVANNHFITKGEIEIRYYGYAGMGEDNEIEEMINYKVIPSTLGQFTGLTDKNGTKIFEGDALKSSNHENLEAFDEWDDIYCTVTWENDGWAFIDNDGWMHWNLKDEESIYSRKYCEVIGNIHEEVQE